MNQLKKFTLVIFLSCVVFSTAKAATDINTLSNDINDLIVQGDDLIAEMQSASLTSFTMSSTLSSIETSVSNYNNNVISVFNTLDNSNTMALTDDLLIGMQTLSNTSLVITNELVSVSDNIMLLSPVTSLSILDSSMASMLTLSNDIGTMADRIGDMADRILIMADNIGFMADRIIETQSLQNGNITLIINAVLQTQKNTIGLISIYSL